MRNRFRTLVVLGAGVLVASLFPATPAAAAPSIQFLNPSGYTAAMRVSDKRDENTSYHLVAWASEIPSNPAVEFELATATLNHATITAEQAGTDTWEGELTVPDTIPDGQYTLRAILYSGLVEVARSEETVTVQAGAAEAETVELTYPEVGSQLGFYTPPSAPTNAVLEGVASEGARQVRAFYTLTEPGREPAWKACGSGSVGDDRNFRARCTLADADPFGRVKAVAVVANTTPPPSDPVVAADETGDAHRVIPYVQTPTALELAPQTAKVDTEDGCTTMTVSLFDQNGQEIANANLDVHAKGPDDQLRFGSIRGETDPFQAPDRGHTGTEPTVKCSPTDPDNQQGEHNVPAAPDLKHIETRSGTTNAGGFTFALRSQTRGGTLLQAWADSNDDDLQAATEASAGAQLGWDTEPPEPDKEVLLDPQFSSPRTSTCQKFTVVVKQGGQPLPTRNVDIHMKDPSGVAFCAPEGSTTRAPDGGDHAGGQHADGTNHAEGETDSTGQLIFGIASENEGVTNITVWLDENGDDIQDPGESNTAGQANWGGEVKRFSTSSSIRYRRGVWTGSVQSRNRKCESKRTVFLRKDSKRGSDKTVGSDTSSKKGAWRIRKRAKKGTYYAVIPEKQFVDRNGDTIVCRQGTSKVKRIR